MRVRPRTSIHRYVRGPLPGGILLLFILLVTVQSLPAHEKFGKLLARAYPFLDPASPSLVLVSFTDKGAKKYRAEELLSAQAIRRRLKVRSAQRVTDPADFPLNQSYVGEVSRHVLSVRHQLKWFNAVSAWATVAQIGEIERLPFVKAIDLIGRWKSGSRREKFVSPAANLSPASRPGAVRQEFSAAARAAFDYGPSYASLRQINVPAVHAMGIYGQGVTICMFDEGVRVPDDPIFDSVNIIGTRDFVDHKESVIPEDPSAGWHGQATFEIIGGFAPGFLIGPAFKANYLLARTENDSSETPVEEDNWAKGIEWADSIGVDVTSTSLVYLTFDPPYPSMTWQDMDGVTALITRAADRADSLGIVVVNAAGNFGRDSTHNTLWAPADGFNVLTVGAVDTLGNIMDFSSNGPTADGRIKPDVMAEGMGGTSFACPHAAGVAALILCAHPGLTPAQVRAAMKNTASDALAPDNFHGWGIVNALGAIFSTREFVRIAGGWNLISLPCRAGNRHAGSLFPLSLSRAFAYDGSYVPSDTMAGGRGYWLKFPGDAPFGITGPPISADTIQVRSSWNMIGSISYPVPAASIGSDPPGITASGFFRYSSGGGYSLSDTILPGGGYWVKVNQPGKLILSFPGQATAGNAIRIVASSDTPPVPPGEEDRVPMEFSLEQNYPNPFNPRTHFRFTVADLQFVTLKVFDVLGREVTTLVDEIKPPGQYSLEWDATNQPSGVYYYRLQAGARLETRKLVLIR